MKLSWEGLRGKSQALMDQFPDQDPLKLSFQKLHKMVCELEDFNGNSPGHRTKRSSKNIQMVF